MDKCIRADGGQCRQPVGYRISSTGPVWGAIWPKPGAREADVLHRCVAIAVASKCRTDPDARIEVVHIGSGDVVFAKPCQEERPAASA